MVHHTDLDLTRSFLVAAEELNFRRTAERLGIDQSALSRRIRKLEHALGFPLFERTTREISLTPAGRSFYEANADLLRNYRRAVDDARRIAEGRSGLVRAGYMAFAAIDLVPRAVMRFRSGSPDVELRLQYMSTQAQKLALANDELDVGFMIGPFQHNDFHSRPLLREPLHVIMSASHALVAYETIQPADIARHDLILGDLSQWAAFRRQLEAMFTSSGLALRISMEASSTLGLLGLVAAGVGITIWPSGITNLLSGRLMSRPIADPAFESQTVLVWKRLNRSASLRKFVAAAEIAAAQPDASAPEEVTS